MKYTKYLFRISLIVIAFFGLVSSAHASWTYYGYSIPYVVVAPDPITVSITANPSSMTLPTNHTTLTWTTTGTPDSCSAFGSWSGSKNPAGSSENMTGLAAGSYSYQIVCMKGSQNASAQVTVVVNPQSPGSSITATLTANPSALPYGGGTTTLAWGSTNATSCTGTNFSTGAGNATSGTTQATLSNTKTYTVTCTGLAGQAQAQATVIVLPNSPINGVCRATHFSCNAGTSTNNSTGATSWTWDCRGSGGGTTASCRETFGPGGGEDNPECSDGNDNDGDLYKDGDDPSCHSDCNATNDSSYNSQLDNEAKRCIKPIYIEL